MRKLILVLSFVGFTFALFGLGETKAQQPQTNTPKGRYVSIEQVPQPYRDQILNVVRNTAPIPPQQASIRICRGKSQQIGCYVFEVCFQIGTGQPYLVYIANVCDVPIN